MPSIQPFYPEAFLSVREALLTAWHGAGEILHIAHYGLLLGREIPEFLEFLHRRHASLAAYQDHCLELFAKDHAISVTFGALDFHNSPLVDRALHFLDEAADGYTGWALALLHRFDFEHANPTAHTLPNHREAYDLRLRHLAALRLGDYLRDELSRFPQIRAQAAEIRAAHASAVRRDSATLSLTEYNRDLFAAEYSTHHSRPGEFTHYRLSNELSTFLDESTLLRLQRAILRRHAERGLPAPSLLPGDTLRRTPSTSLAEAIRGFCANAERAATDPRSKKIFRDARFEWATDAQHHVAVVQGHFGTGKSFFSLAHHCGRFDRSVYLPINERPRPTFWQVLTTALQNTALRGASLADIVQTLTSRDVMRPILLFLDLGDSVDFEYPVRDLLESLDGFFTIPGSGLVHVVLAVNPLLLPPGMREFAASPTVLKPTAYASRSYNAARTFRGTFCAFGIAAQYDNDDVLPHLLSAHAPETQKRIRLFLGRYQEYLSSPLAARIAVEFALNRGLEEAGEDPRSLQDYCAAFCETVFDGVFRAHGFGHEDFCKHLVALNALSLRNEDLPALGGSPDSRSHLFAALAERTPLIELLPVATSARNRRPFRLAPQAQVYVARIQLTQPHGPVDARFAPGYQLTGGFADRLVLAGALTEAGPRDLLQAVVGHLELARLPVVRLLAETLLGTDADVDGPSFVLRLVSQEKLLQREVFFELLLQHVVVRRLGPGELRELLRLVLSSGCAINLSEDTRQAYEAWLRRLEFSADSLREHLVFLRNTEAVGGSRDSALAEIIFRPLSIALLDHLAMKGWRAGEVTAWVCEHGQRGGAFTDSGFFAALCLFHFERVAAAVGLGFFDVIADRDLFGPNYCDGLQKGAHLAVAHSLYRPIERAWRREEQDDKPLERWRSYLDGIRQGIGRAHTGWIFVLEHSMSRIPEHQVAKVELLEYLADVALAAGDREFVATQVLSRLRGWLGGARYTDLGVTRETREAAQRAHRRIEERMRRAAEKPAVADRARGASRRRQGMRERRGGRPRRR